MPDGGPWKVHISKFGFCEDGNIENMTGILFICSGNTGAIIFILHHQDDIRFHQMESGATVDNGY